MTSTTKQTKATAPVVNCVECGLVIKPIYRPIYSKWRNQFRMFCNKSCKQTAHNKSRSLVSDKSRTKSNSTRSGVCISARRELSNGPRVCCSCGYSGPSIDACHLLQYGDFPQDAQISEINAPGNIRFMCKNCHWEYDHNTESAMEEFKVKPQSTPIGVVVRGGEELVEAEVVS